MNKRDIGRWRICEEIAKFVPYSVDTVYDVYEYVLEQNKKTTNVVKLDKQLESVKIIFHHAATWQLSPLSVAYAIYELSPNET